MHGNMPAPSHSRQPGTGSAWFDEPLALDLMREEQRQATPLLTQYIGVRGLYLRPGSRAPLELSGNMLQSITRLHRQGDRLAGDLDCALDLLPFDNDTFCLVYALHMLEDVEAPAQTLAELARVLRPEGVALVVTLSPLSPWRLRWGRRGLIAPSAPNLRSWLASAGLATEREIGLGPVLPWIGPASERRQWPQACRAGSLVVARKRRAGLTALPSRQRAVRVRAHAPV